MKRQHAQLLGLPTYVPDTPCKRGHLERYVRNGGCVQCHKESKKSPEGIAYQKWYGYKRRQEAKQRARTLVNSARYRAIKRKLPFDLTIDFVANAIEKGKCPITGIGFILDAPQGTRTHPWAPSIDRKDTAKGYTRDNIQIVCAIYNMAKNDYGHVELMRLASNLVARFPWENSQ
jgi:hypothetical protein